MEYSQVTWTRLTEILREILILPVIYIKMEYYLYQQVHHQQELLLPPFEIGLQPQHLYTRIKKLELEQIPQRRCFMLRELVDLTEELWLIE